MTKLLKLILPLAVMLSTFSGCNNIFKDNSQPSQETTSQTASETVSETTAEQTEAKKEIKGDMTIRKAYKLENIKAEFDFPWLIGEKIINGLKTGEALSKFGIPEVFGEYQFGFYPIDVVVIDGITGEQNTIYSDIMLQDYDIIPGNDEKTAYLEYYDKTNTTDTATIKTFKEVHKHKRVIKLDLDNMTYKELDFSKYEGEGITFCINPIVDNKLLVTQYKEFPVTDKDFEGRDFKDEDENSTVDSTTIDVMDLNSGEVKNFYYDKMDECKIIPGEKRIDYIWTDFYDNMTIFYTEELTADNTYKVGFQVYDENMNLIYEDVVDSIDNYKDGDFIAINSGACNGDIYVSWNKCKSDGTDYYADCIYHKKGNTYEKSQPKTRTRANGGYYQYTTKTHPEFNYGISQINDDTYTSTQLKLINYCTEEEIILDIEVDGFEAPDIAMDGDINYNGSGNTLIFGNGSFKERNLVFWFVPKDEIKRAIYGE